MVDIGIVGPMLVVTLTGWDRVWALKQRVEVSLDHIERVTIDPETARKPDGFKAPGSYWPGKITAGTYRRRGSKSFWSVRNPNNAIIIDLKNEEFSRLVLEVLDPVQTAAIIESATNRQRLTRTETENQNAR